MHQSTDGGFGLAPVWQAAIAGCVLLVTVLGLRRLAVRGPARMRTGIVVTGALIVAITVVGSLAVSCSGPDNRGSEIRSPGR